MDKPKEIYMFHYWNRGFYKEQMNIVDYYSKPFLLPESMSKKEGFLVLSYLFNSIISKLNADKRNPSTIIATIDALNSILSYYGFNAPTSSDFDEPQVFTRLFIIDDEYRFFDCLIPKKEYIPWYRRHVSLRRVSVIYSRLGMDFQDINEALGKSDEETKNQLVKKMG